MQTKAFLLPTATYICNCFQNANAKISRQLETLRKQDKELRSELQASQEARGSQDRLLDSASKQIDGLRRELKSLTARQATRDQRLLQHVEVCNSYQLLSVIIHM